VAGAEVEKFNSVSGIGPKTAKLIILSLTGKLVTENYSDNTSSVDNVISALMNLGFQERKARSVTEELVKEHADLTEQELLRQALSSLSAARRVSGND
jgi:Holliday junction DNA helicase RuvA